jgi:hypothetical protein
MINLAEAMIASLSLARRRDIFADPRIDSEDLRAARERQSKRS